MNTILAVITGDTLLAALIYVVIAALVFWLGNWFLSYVGVGEPFLKIGKIILAVFAFVFLLNALFAILGRPFIIIGR